MVECQDQDIVSDDPCFLIIVEILILFGNELFNPVFFKKVTVADVANETPWALVDSHLNVFGLASWVFIFRVNLNLVESNRFFRLTAVLGELSLDLFLNPLNDVVDIKVFDLGVQVLVTNLLDAAHPLDVVKNTLMFLLIFLAIRFVTFNIVL